MKLRKMTQMSDKIGEDCKVFIRDFISNLNIDNDNNMFLDSSEFKISSYWWETDEIIEKDITGVEVKEITILNFLRFNITEAIKIPAYVINGEYWVNDDEFESTIS